MLKFLLSYKFSFHKFSFHKNDHKINNMQCGFLANGDDPMFGWDSFNSFFVVFSRVSNLTFIFV